MALLVITASGRGLRSAFASQPTAWILGIGGLFGYHALYFTALQLAPPVEANLINYLWPLLIVLLAGVLTEEPIRAPQFAGALLGLAGTALLIVGTGSVTARTEFLPGYLAALGCAIVWATYSVLNRRLGAVPTDAVAGLCLATALLATVAHFLTETTVVPSATQWVVIAAMGLGPVGAAFYLWDHGVKRGDIQMLGTISYATPLASTLILLASGRGEPTPTLMIAALLIVGGATIASTSASSSRATSHKDEVYQSATHASLPSDRGPTSDSKGQL